MGKLTLKLNVHASAIESVFFWIPCCGKYRHVQINRYMYASQKIYGLCSIYMNDKKLFFKHARHVILVTEISHEGGE